MQDIERQNNILKFLKEKHSATVDLLAKTFYASPSTIRRDLTQLEKTGMIHRTHGGAIYNDRIKEVSIIVRKSENEEAKNKIAEIAVKHIPEFNSIFIDNSSTCFALLRLLDLNKKTVVTNSLLMVTEIKSLFDANVVFLGGDYEIDNMSTSGMFTIENLSYFHFDLMIQSAAYVCNDGAFENEYKTALIKKVARQRANYKMLIFDKTKMKKSATCLSSNLTDFDIIVSDIDNEEKDKLLKEIPSLNIINE